MGLISEGYYLGIIMGYFSFSGSALDFRSGGLWFEPSLCRRVVSVDKKLYFALFFFTQVYKCVPAIMMLEGVWGGGGGITLRWTSIPSRGSSNIPSRFMLQKPELSAGLMDTWLVCRLNLHLIELAFLSLYSSAASEKQPAMARKRLHFTSTKLMCK